MSRAVRTPGDGEYFGVLSYPVFTAFGLGYYSPEPTVRSEDLIAYQAGYRFQVQKRLSVDLAAYCSDHGNVIAQATNGQTMGNGLPRVTSQNLISGLVSGGEAVLTYLPADSWRLTAWYALSRADLEAPPAGQPDARRAESRVPRHQAYLQSSLDLA